MLTRRALLAAAGAGTTSLLWPRFSGARETLEVDVPGGVELIRSVLESYPESPPPYAYDGSGVVTARIGSGIRITVRLVPEERRWITVSAHGRSVHLSRLAGDGRVGKVTAHTDPPVTLAGHLDRRFPRQPLGFDTLLRKAKGVVLTYSDDLSLRYVNPRAVKNASLPAIYGRFARRVMDDCKASLSKEAERPDLALRPQRALEFL